MPLKLNLQTSD